MNYLIMSISLVVLFMVLFIGMIIGVYASILWGSDFNKILIGIYRRITGENRGKEPEKIVITKKITRYPKDK
jgi:preprotein translocase subunit SecF